MKRKSIFFTVIVIFLIFSNTTFSQNNQNPISKEQKNIKERLAIVEKNQSTIVGTIGSTIGLIGFYTAATGIFLSVLALGSLSVFFLRKFILKDLYESIRKDFDKEIQELKNTFNQEIDFFKEEIKSKIDNSQQLINLVKNCLELGFDEDEAVSLKERIRKEPDPAQENIFTIAVGFQREIFRRDDNFNELIERLIPIYKGIIESDDIENQKYFRSRANLSYVYNYKLNPDLYQAKHYIDKSIEIRECNKKTTDSFYFYEFMRAIYLIKMDRRINTDLEKLSQISKDIEKSASNFYTVKSIIKDAVNNTEFNEEYHRRYIIKEEFYLLKDWLGKNLEVVKSFKFLQEEQDICN